MSILGKIELLKYIPVPLLSALSVLKELSSVRGDTFHHSLLHSPLTGANALVSGSKVLWDALF